ncbi:MAG: PEP-CTERM sorting domain-containing protein [Sedimentisphaerales bacterium]
MRSIWFGVVIVLTSTASATILGTVDIQNHNNGLSDIGTVWGGGLSGLTGYTGIYSWTNAGGTDLGALVPDWGFCIELIQGPYTGWHNVIPLNEAPLPPALLYDTPMGTTKADYIRELWGRDFDPSWLTGGTANKRMAEAFGAAVWEIIYEALPSSPLIWDVNTGTGFHATGIEQAATANTWLHQLNGDTAHFAKNLYAISTLKGQDYLVQVPEPATLLLLTLGITLIKTKRK